MLWESTEESCDICECTSLISNSFTLNSGGRSPLSRRNEQRARGAQRRLNILPQKINYDQEECTSPVKDMSAEELSFYNGNSPQPSPRSCSFSPFSDMAMLSPETSPRRFISDERSQTIEPRTIQTQRSFEVDYNSVDSGYSINYSQDANQHLNALPASLHGSNKYAFQFAEPSALPPRRSPVSKSSGPTKSPLSGSYFKDFHTLSSGSMDSMDEEYVELFEMESIDEDALLPSGLNSLISGNIMTSSNTPEHRRPSFRRCISLSENNIQKARTSLSFIDTNRADIRLATPEPLKQLASSTTPNSTRVLDGGRCFKRPEAPLMSPINSKRHKTESLEDKENVKVNRILRKSMSMNDAILDRMELEDMIGDLSRKFCLPKMNGGVSGLRSTTSDAVAKLINGDYDDFVASYKIIDCRYPYEYEGGHIDGAVNLYTQEQIMGELLNTVEQTASADSKKHHILIFHCEFSSERGPKLLRFLRESDRKLSTYPALQYPEVYLLHNGYKEFFETHKELCTPNSYRPMLDKSFEHEYRKYRIKTKSGNLEQRTSSASNSSSSLTNFRPVKSRSLIM